MKGALLILAGLIVGFVGFRLLSGGEMLLLAVVAFVVAIALIIWGLMRNHKQHMK